MQWDIIPDIHGQVEKLKGALSELGYQEHAKVWRHSDPDRTCVFLGDFIDRGPNNAEVIDIVRRMIDAGTAQAIMGNHELNAIHFHTGHPETGKPLRARSEKNLKQHATFLSEFPIGAPETKDAITWMQSLPLFLEAQNFRAVHACWNEAAINSLKAITPTGVLGENDLIRAADKSDPIYGSVDITAKGPEAKLPQGLSFTDIGGTRREKARLQWWNGQAATWRDIVMSVPDPMQLPEDPLPASVSTAVYSSSAKPVFFGHYWMSGTPILQAPNALCLDYSAGRTGPLMSYQMMPSDDPLSLTNLTQHGAKD